TAQRTEDSEEDTLGRSRDGFNQARDGVLLGFDIHRQLSSRRVAEVTGPIEASLMPCSVRGASLAMRLTKFRAVDELVKVITFGRRLGSFRVARNRTREDGGTTVS